MKHVLVLAALVAAIAWLVMKPSTLDRLATASSGTGQAESGFVEVDAGKLPVTPAYFAVPGHPTVVIFHDDVCPGCRKLDADLQDFMRQRPDVAVRKVRVDLARLDLASRDYQWNIHATPCVLIYDAKGKLVVADDKLDTAAYDMLYNWINREAERDFKARQKGAVGASST